MTNLAARRERAREDVAALDVAALVVTDPSNIRWLTGFTGSAGTVWLPADGEAVLVTDARYAERAEEETGGMPVVLDRTWGWLPERIHASGWDTEVRVALETAAVSWATVRQLEELVEGAVDLIPSDGVVMTLRQRKDDAEIAALRRACAITSKAFEAILPDLRPGASETAIARRLVSAMADLGAEGPAFEPIVASGPNGSRPHHLPAARPVERGDLVTMDFGALVEGYHADMTRTVAVGEPGPALRRIHELVRTAQQAGVDAVADGVGVADVDRACRDVIADAGHGEDFRHGTGHGVGLDIHEPPFLASTAAGTLASRMTVTVEPGVYVSGLGGVRIEDVVLVTSTGAERLTTAPRELIVL